MKVVNQRRWISILLIIVMMLTGMCFDKSKVHPDFWYTAKGENQNILNISRSVLQNQDFCTEDLLGIHIKNGTSIQESRTNIKVNSKVRVVLSILENLSQGSMYIAENAVEKVICNAVFSTVAIIGYIHRQDGKKS